MFTRTRYQNGSLRVKSREKGLRVWEFRYYEPCQDGTGEVCEPSRSARFRNSPAKRLPANRPPCKP